MLAQDVARLAALVDEDLTQDPLDWAQDICELCRGLTGVSGVALSIAGGGPGYVSSTVCGTDALSMHLEELQLGLAEGPLGDALGSASPVLAADLAADPRWLWFAPSAVDAGAAAVFVFPLCAGQTCIGALSLYRRSAGDLAVDELDDFAAVADGATKLLLPAFVHSGDEPDWWALGERTGFQPEIPQAVGVLIAELHVDPEQAMARLRGYAFAAGESIGEVAHEIVTRRLHLENDAA